MKSLALFFALGIVVIGVVGVVAPNRLITTAYSVLTPVGLYAIAALRVVMGIVLIRVAPVSRAPETLRAIGAVILIAGLATPVFGLDRSRAVAHWAAAQDAVILQGVGGLMAAIGAFIAFVVSTDNRRA